jgi:hypothetical protein
VQVATNVDGVRVNTQEIIGQDRLHARASAVAMAAAREHL